ncbi:MAG: hypothetical protein H0X03_09780 [Nitrosopumilus sp.]|nr:hypothetical protein [Nitrosopumilus sp.]
MSFILKNYRIQIDYISKNVTYKEKEKELMIPCAIYHAIDLYDKKILKCLLVDNKKVFVDSLSEESKYYLFCELIEHHYLECDIIKLICPDNFYDKIEKVIKGYQKVNKLKIWMHQFVGCVQYIPKSSNEMIIKVICSGIMCDIISGIYLIKTDGLKFYLKLKNIRRLVNEFYKIEEINCKMIKDVMETICVMAGIDLGAEDGDNVKIGDDEKLKKYLDKIDDVNVEYAITKLGEMRRIITELLMRKKDDVLFKFSAKDLHFFNNNSRNKVCDLDKYIEKTMNTLNNKKIEKVEIIKEIVEEILFVVSETNAVVNNSKFIIIRNKLKLKVKRLLLPLKWPVKVEQYDILFEKLMDSEYKFMQSKTLLEVYYKNEKIIKIYKIKTKSNKLEFRQYGSNIGSKKDSDHMYSFVLYFQLNGLSCEYYIEKKDDRINNCYHYYGEMMVNDKWVIGRFEYYVNDSGSLFHRCFKKLNKLPKCVDFSSDEK